MVANETREQPIHLDELLTWVGAYANPDDVSVVRRSYELAHATWQPGGSSFGRQMLLHALATAQILAELETRADTVAAALLVECPEKELRVDSIRTQVGEPVADLVESVGRMRRLPYLSSENKLAWSDKQRAELYHAFVSAVESPQPILIELAHQLNRLRNLSTFFSTEQRKIVSDALNIYAPLAHRLGIRRIKWQMEDRAFRFTHPEEYHRISAALREQREERERQIQQIAAMLRAELSSQGIESRISGRPKHIYSIYQKMQRKGVPLEAVYDLRALRVLVDDQASCYRALSVVHSTWTPIDGEYDDYVSNPKSNGYRSLHTAVIDEEGGTLEVQIRSHDMHTEAELGVAAHWRYKERHGSKRKSRKKRQLDAEQAVEERISWLRSMLVDTQDAEAEVRGAPAAEPGPKDEARSELIFVSTPLGDVIRLPAGATPIDFAYRIHTELGHRCYGAKVNGSVVRLDHRLESGDQVEITTKDRGGPNASWLSKDNRFVKTREARKKIAAWFRAQEREKNIARGHEILDRELSKLGLRSTRSFEEIAGSLNLVGAEELLVQLGSDTISLEKLRTAIVAQPKPTKEERAREAEEELVTAEEETKTLIEKRPDDELITPSPEGAGLVIASTGGLFSRIAHCCYPVPQEEIVGFVTRGHGVTIHRKECPNVTAVQESDRIISADWGQMTDRIYPVLVFVEALNRRGLMGDIGQAVAQVNVDIAEATVKKRSHWAMFELVIEVTDADQLAQVLDRVAHTQGVRKVYRRMG